MLQGKSGKKRIQERFLVDMNIFLSSRPEKQVILLIEDR